MDGIHNVIDVLEQLEMGKLPDIEFVEAQACIGGCVGGALTVLNPFIGRMNLEALVGESETPPNLFEELDQGLKLRKRLGEFAIQPDIVAVPVFWLDYDVSRAIT